MTEMQGFLIAWSHGSLTIASLWALCVWTTLLVSRPFAEEFSGFRKDTYLWVAIGNVLGCIGTFMISGSRSVDIAMDNGVPTYSFPLVVVLGLFCLVTSRTAMVYASSLNNKPWRWRWFILVMLIWSLFCSWWQLA